MSKKNNKFKYVVIRIIDNHPDLSDSYDTLDAAKAHLKNNFIRWHKDDFMGKITDLDLDDIFKDPYYSQHVWYSDTGCAASSILQPFSKKHITWRIMKIETSSGFSSFLL